MAIHFIRVGLNAAPVIDHNNLLNKGVKTHAEIDTFLGEAGPYLDEIDAARGSFGDLDERLTYIQEHSTGGPGGGGGISYVQSESLSNTRPTPTKVFTVPAYTVNTGQIEVYYDGVLLSLANGEYTETDGTTITTFANVPTNVTMKFRVPSVGTGAVTPSAIPLQNKIIKTLEDHTTSIAAAAAAATTAQTNLTNTGIKAEVANVANLPGSGNTTGDVRFVISAGQFYNWNGTAWLPGAGALKGTSFPTTGLYGGLSFFRTDLDMFFIYSSNALAWIHQ